MKITGRTMMLADRSVDESIACLKEIGFEGIELCLLQHDFQFRPDMVEPFFAAHTLETCKRLEIPIYSVSYHTDYIFNDSNFNNLKKSIAATPLYGIKTCIFAGAAKRIGNTMQADWALSVARVKELLAIAATHDVNLAMEFEPGMVCGNTTEFLQLRKDIADEALLAHLKVNLDIGHTFLCEADPLASIAQLEGLIVHGHVENMARGVHRHLPPHMGDMVIADYFKAAYNAGFDGAFGLDLYQDDYTEVGPDAVVFLKEELKKAGLA